MEDRYALEPRDVLPPAAERAADLGKGDLVHITGRVRQNSYESNGETRYSVDLIAEGLGILVRGGAD